MKKTSRELNKLEKYSKIYTWRGKLVIHAEDHIYLKYFPTFILDDSRLKGSSEHGRVHQRNKERKEHSFVGSWKSSLVKVSKRCDVNIKQ